MLTLVVDVVEVRDDRGPAAESEAFDLLAAWMMRGAGARDVQRAISNADGTFEVILSHEHGRARSTTQRTLARGIRNAIALARGAGSP